MWHTVRVRVVEMTYAQRISCNFQPVMFESKSSLFVDKETDLNSVNQCQTSSRECEHDRQLLWGSIVCPKEEKKNAAVYRGPLCVWAVSMGTSSNMCLAVTDVWRGDVLPHNQKLLSKKLKSSIHQMAKQILSFRGRQNNGNTCSTAWHTLNSISTCGLQTHHTAGSTSIWNSFS